MKEPFLRRSAPPRNDDEAKPYDGKDRAAQGPWALVEHKARGGPLEDTGALTNPQQARQQSGDAADQEKGLHGRGLFRGCGQP